MKHLKKLLAFLLALALLAALLPGSALAISSSVGNFYDANLTGDGAADMVAIAFAQQGRTYKAFSGYNAPWCAQFVSDCAAKVGQSEAIPGNSWCDTLASNILNAGGWVVSKSEAQPGDICFYDKNKNGQSDHVEIVYKRSGSTISTIGGNSGSPRQVVAHGDSAKVGYIMKIVRPNYKSNYANLGSDFYAVILNKHCWKPISETAGTDRITLQTETGTARQKWHFVRQGDGSYVITSCYDGKALEMTDGNTTVGTQMTARTSNGADYQKWFLISMEGGYVFRSKHDMERSWTMNLFGGYSDDGTSIIIRHEQDTFDDIWAVYTGSEVQLQPTTLSYSLNAPTVTFTWPNRYGAKNYNLRIFKDTLYTGTDYTVWNTTSGKQVDLPAGTYKCYVDSCDYYDYKQSNILTVTVPQKQMTVTFDAAGGSTGTSSKTVTFAETYGTLPTPTRARYAFEGWYTSASGGTRVTESTKVTAKANHTLYAHWTQTCADGHDFVATAVHAPTCSDEGYTEYICSRCGILGFDNYTPVIAHDYQNGVCTVCGETLLTVTFDCDEGATYFVNYTRDTSQIDEYMPTVAYPRNPDTGLIDCSGWGDIFFGVSVDPWYELVDITATPESAYGTTFFEFTTEETTHDRLISVHGNVTIHIEVRSTATPLEITQQPECVNVANGETASVSVAARGDTPQYEWYYKDPGMTEFSPAGVTSANYSVTMTAARNGRQLFCRITDIHGDSVDSNPVILTNENYIRDYGPCGENLTWVLDSMGKLTIFGTSEMYDYAPWTGDYPGWHDYCTNIGQIVFDSTGPNVGEYAFAGCSMLTSVTLPPTLTEIEDCSFVGCESLESVTIPDSVTAIGASAFACCEALTDISIPAAVTNIGDYAFSECYGLTAITVAAANPRYSSLDGVLYNKEQTTLICCPCGRVSPLAIPNTVTRIEEQAFFCCWDLEAVTIPASVTSIGIGAFDSCEALTGITVPSSVTRLESWVFGNCTNLKDVSLPSSLTSIGQSAFQCCHGLERITIPARVSSIGKYAFEMFSQYESLNEIVFTGSAPTIGENAFKGVTATAYYPADDATWTAAVLQDYGGTITWVAGSPPAAAPEILTQPTDASATPGQAVSFRVAARGDGLSYQWYYYKPGQNSPIAVSAASGKTAEYTLTAQERHNGYRYYCKVSNAGGFVDSDVVTLTVAPAFAIVTQPQDVAAPEGETISITIEATGAGLTYQWYVKKPTATKFSKSSITGATYSVTLTEARNGNQVYCVVTDAAGNTVRSNTVTMTVAEPLSVADLEDFTGPVNSTVTFTVQPAGAGPFTYQWYVKKPTATKFSKSSITEAAYSVTLTEARNGNQVYCVVTDAAGDTVRTNTVTMTVAEPLSVADLEDYVGPVNSTVTFTVQPTGAGPFSYQWYVKKPTATKFSKSSITEAAYSVTLTEARNGNQVYCVVTDAAGDTVRTNTVSMTVGAAFNVADLTDYVGPLGSKASFTVTANGEGLTYVWYVKPASGTDFVRSSISKATYSVTLTEARNGNQVYCVVTDSAGNSVRTNTVAMTVG